MAEFGLSIITVKYDVNFDWMKYVPAELCPYDIEILLLYREVCQSHIQSFVADANLRERL